MAQSSAFCEAEEEQVAQADFSFCAWRNFSLRLEKIQVMPTFKHLIKGS
ncbi:MAG: hypothetical protein MSH18_00190 [Bacteroidales bacterium]|nr:hypothetical protein [Bacteroidales bacterium]